MKQNKLGATSRSFDTRRNKYNDKRLNHEEETEAERGTTNNKGEDTRTGKNKYKNRKRKKKYKNWTSATGKARLNTIVTNWFDKFEKKTTLKDYAKKQGIDVSTLGPFCRRDPLKRKKLAAASRSFDSCSTTTPRIVDEHRQ